MKANELMIGDWVWNTHNQQAEQVQEIREQMVMLAYNDLYEYDEIEPIRLTDNILIASGFSVGKYKLPVSGNEIDKYSYVDLTNHIKECVLLPLTKNYIWSFGSIDGMEVPIIEYVHQLQHALRLCGIDKEIIIKED